LGRADALPAILGQCQTRVFGDVRYRSAYPLIADIAQRHWYARFVPKADKHYVWKTGDHQGFPGAQSLAGRWRQSHIALQSARDGFRWRVVDPSEKFCTDSCSQSGAGSAAMEMSSTRRPRHSKTEKDKRALIDLARTWIQAAARSEGAALA